MYNTKDLIGKVITVKLLSGLEIISKLIGYDDKKGILTIDNPKIIVVAEGEVATMPFTFTGNSVMTFIRESDCLAIFESAEASAEDYVSQLTEPKAPTEE